eukprot:scaffold38582_cov57-Attheya_sp.AAC.2
MMVEGTEPVSIETAQLSPSPNNDKENTQKTPMQSHKTKRVLSLKLDENESDTTVILPHLLVSRYGDAILDTPDKLLEADIVYLINCCGDESSNTRMNRTHLSSHEGFNILDLNIKDESHEKLEEALSLVFPLVKKAKQAHAFFRSFHVVIENKKCLIYCKSGMSRSVSIAVAYLTAFEKMSLIEAMTHVKNCRRMASPNPGFMSQLITLERAADRKRGGDGSSLPTIDIDLYRKDRFGEPNEIAFDSKRAEQWELCRLDSLECHADRERGDSSRFLSLLQSGTMDNQEITESKKVSFTTSLLSYEGLELMNEYLCSAGGCFPISEHLALKEVTSFENNSILEDTDLILEEER